MSQITTGRRRIDPATRAANAAAKRARIAEERNSTRQQGWRPVNLKEECFYPKGDDLPGAESYLQCNIRPTMIGTRDAISPTRFEIFRRFITDELIIAVLVSFTMNQFTMS